MEGLGGGSGPTALRISENQGRIPTADRYLEIFQTPSFIQSDGQNFELSEHDIFSISCGSCLPSPAEMSEDPKHRIKLSPTDKRSNYGILAVLNENFETGSGTTVPPFVNRRVSVSAALSSSLSTSPAVPNSVRIAIPRPQPPLKDRRKLVPQSAPVDVPMMPVEIQRRVREMDDVVSEGEDEEDSTGMFLPPHEVIVGKDTPLLSCSVVEGAGRTLKGRDLRQVRNAVWRKTGFMN